MRFDTIVVPRGAEASAVERGWPPPRPSTIAVAAGAAASRSLSSVRDLHSVLVLGVCGALDPVLRVGDAVVYARIVDGVETIELDAELAAACAVACDRVPVVAANVAAVVGEPAAKAELRKATGAAVVDMEAAAIARALHRENVRVAMVRVVSDSSGGALPDLRNIYDRDGALRPGALAAALIRSPLRGAAFIRNALRALRALRSTAARLAVATAD